MRPYTCRTFIIKHQSLLAIFKHEFYVQQSSILVHTKAPSTNNVALSVFSTFSLYVNCSSDPQVFDAIESLY